MIKKIDALKSIKITIALIILCIIVLLCMVLFWKNNTIYENTITETLESVELMSMMLETTQNSGVYEMSTDIEWPDPTKYEFNYDLSSCENGGTLTWNETDNTVTYTGSYSDKCYVYFDLIPPDVTITTNNTNLSTYNASTQATLTCTDATSSYSQKYQAIEISDITSKYATCILTYSTPDTKTYLNDYVISLSGNGEVVEENGYRYEGKNPNNYVWFNNELWRIIGVFGEETHGVSGTNLVKIIKATELDGYAWHKSNTNDWTAASLNSLLNSYYYYGLDGTESGYCYGYSTTVTKTCNYGTTGISTSARAMIEEVTWYLGGYSSTSATAESFYSYERSGDYVYSGRATSTTGYIGLMYASDYGYSVLSSSCARTTNLGSYNTATCAGQSWLYGVSNEWIITPHSSSSSYVFVVNNNGYLYYYDANGGRTVRPVLYLDSSVYIVSGIGTESDPIILAM